MAYCGPKKINKKLGAHYVVPVVQTGSASSETSRNLCEILKIIPQKVLRFNQ
jgi:hypothetical protein